MALKTNMGDFVSTAEKVQKGFEEKILFALHTAGESFVKECREQPQGHDKGFYDDQTGNLRNSIGYYIYKDGQLIEEGTTKVNNEENKGLISDLVEESGWTLIGVAGMNYASYVEAKGYNVISNQADQVFVDLDEYAAAIQKWLDNGAK